MNEVKTATTIQATIGAACYRCRGFRHACDRTKPACSRCKRRGITCTYPEAAPTLKKLQKATETLGDRIKKFGELLKTGEHGPLPNKNKGISLQRLAQPRSTVAPEIDSPSNLSIDTLMEDNVSTTSTQVASTSSFSVYPCTKCFKDLQQCDLTLPSCSRCAEGHFECVYTKTEPKANHVSQVLNTMNKVMDQWQESIDKMAKDFAQKTRDFGQRVDQSFKKSPLQPFAWKITSTNKGLSVESNVNSFNDLSKLVDQFKRTMHISPRDPEPDPSELADDPSLELDDTSSIHTSSSFSFGFRNIWTHHSHASEEDCHVEITQELTDSLVELYCKTPCCSTNRLPVLDTMEFLTRYHEPDKRPSDVLVHAVCALAARNAFQIHVWSKRPEDEMSEYNMGKAISVAYCQKGRELLAECFDDPTFDNCQAAFLLSYCNQQNGHFKVVSMYEWIAFTMAQELGLYDDGRVLSTQESMLVWCIYYFNSWYRVLQGELNSSTETDQFYPSCPLPMPPPKPELDFMQIDAEPPLELIHHYTFTAWYYLLQLQVIHQDVLCRLLSGQQDTTLARDLLVMQTRLEQFYESLLPEWKSPDLESISLDQMATSAASSPFDVIGCPSQHSMDIHEFARSCMLSVHVAYNMNKILIYQAFFPSDHVPTSPFSIQCLNICIDAAYAITQTLDIMVKQRNECSIFLLGFLFANMVYIKLLDYHDPQYQAFARRCLEQSINICKMSKAYLYDLELTRNFVSIMEQDIHNAFCMFSH
ncbi:uncharacterized protein B0P05DRAFT_556335 [Gilbertella persicaria]|uniref:uncharacterized protein n=1 Tax=Gilbertella persicaria TaxID=101096 RepID=UPI00221E8F5F|nr:uncharacterized protein B0P05DRAFT_556335 [Gilbertella persicaria]KAI8062841.1 hypothetical protein B0P05DRAFT_556335 [Gilbertella persicaria]